MMAARRMIHTITVVSVTQDGPPDEMGDPTTETTETEYVRGGYIWQTSRDDRTANANTQVEEWRGILRRDVVVDGTDRLIVEGQTFELDGPPWPARNPRTDRVEFLEVTLRRTT